MSDEVLELPRREVRKRRRDYQRSRVYKYEAALLPAEDLPSEVSLRDPFPAWLLEFYGEVCAWAARKYRPAWRGHQPPLKFSSRMIQYSGTAGYIHVGAGEYELGIRLGFCGLTKRTLLHEIAHLIAGTANGEGHGPKFCRIALDLYVEFLGVDEHEALSLARKHRVEIAAAAEVVGSNR